MTKPIKPLSKQIEEYKNHPKFHEIQTVWNYEEKKFNRVIHTWNWDESWDGQLIKDVTALEQAGFTIVSFSRKRKVTIKLSDEFIDDMCESGSVYGTTERGYIVEQISLAVGDTWYSISFKPTLSIYWKGRSSSWKY